MKTRILSVIAILILTAAALQAQVEFGVVAGPNFQNMVGKDAGGDKITNGLIVGFHAGVSANIPIAPDFYFQTGLLFSQKGSKNNMGLIPVKASNDDYNTTTRISYIDLPLHLLFRPALGNGHMIVGFGPYVAFGIGGKQMVDYGSLPTMEQKVKFESEITSEERWDLENTYFKRFDAGADIFFGYEMSMGLWFRLNAQLGLLNMIPDVADYDGEANLKNTGFGLSVGYNF
ncbi:MAG TPA: PorT family protein [Bacteroidales bacterium]|nr:PorT family protein [Bacteroidales bacterium]